jgi:hypothetical protein
MTKRRIVFMLVLCFSMALLTVQAISQTRSSRASTAERKREIEKSREEARSERERKKREWEKRSAERKRRDAEKAKEAAKAGRGPSISPQQRLKRFREEAAERSKEFLREKWALGATPDKWTLIKAKLEEVRWLKEQANSTIRVLLAGSIGSAPGRKTGAGTTAPLWQWDDPWKGKPPDEMTEAQRLAKQLVALMGRNSTTPEAFRLKMDALRKARSEEAEPRRQLSEVQRELREMLTPRQEAALALMKWL